MCALALSFMHGEAYSNAGCIKLKCKSMWDSAFCALNLCDRSNAIHCHFLEFITDIHFLSIKEFGLLGPCPAC